MPTHRAPSRRRRPPRSYHHGNLRQALLEEALRTIQTGGVEELTLRAVGERLGVSRTALYRHFTDKAALLAAVACDGFRMLRVALTDAWREQNGGRAGFTAMGLAYVHFAVANPSHYRVMFGGFVATSTPDPELAQEGSAAFQALHDALVALQQSGDVRRDEAMQLALFIWAAVHGIATLAIDGHLAHRQADVDALASLAMERLWTGIGEPRTTNY